MFTAPRRRSAILTVLVLLVGYVVAAVAVSGPASATSPVTFTVTGHGRVTTTDANTSPKINCGDGATTCTATIADDCTYIFGICIPYNHAANFTLTADPGYSVVSAPGCSVGAPPTSGTCTANSTTGGNFHITFSDITPPTVALTAPPDGATVPGSATVAATANDSSGQVASVQFFVNGALALTDTTAPYGGQVDLRSATGHTATLSAQATDAAGNKSALSSRTVSVDATPPVVAITKHPKHTVKTHRKKAKVSFTFVTEPGATLRCTLDRRAVACTAHTTFTVKTGRHTLGVTATDAVGNTSAPATFSWKVKRIRTHR